MMSGNGGSVEGRLVIEHPGGRLEAGQGEPPDLVVVRELGLRLGVATPWGIPVMPYAEAPWDCSRRLLGRDGPIDLLTPKGGGKIRLEAPPKSVRKRMFRVGSGRARERGAGERGGPLSIAGKPSGMGGGHLPEVAVDVIVVGGGLSGLSAALTAAEAGARVMVVNFQQHLGGFLSGLASPSELEGGSKTSEEIVSEIISRLLHLDNVNVVTGASLVHAPGGGRYLVETGEGHLLVKAKALVVATGGVDARPVFAGNWYPGVVSASYIMRLVRASIRLRSVAIVGWSDWTLRLAGFLASRYADKVIVVSKRSIDSSLPFYEYAAEYGVELVIDRISRAQPEPEGIRLDFREYESIAVDAVVSTIGPYPDAITPMSVGADVTYLDSTRAPTATIDESMASSERIFAAGLAAGFTSEASAYWSGRLAGIAAATAAGKAAEADGAVERAELLKHSQAADRIAETRSPGGDAPLVEPDMFMAPGVGPDQAIARCPPIWLDELDAYLRATRSPAAAVEAIRLAENLDAGRESLPAIVQFSSMILGVPPGEVTREVVGRIRSVAAPVGLGALARLA